MSGVFGDTGDQHSLKIEPSVDPAAGPAPVSNGCQTCGGTGILIHGKELPCPSCSGDETYKVLLVDPGQWAGPFNSIEEAEKAQTEAEAYLAERARLGV